MKFLILVLILCIGYLHFSQGENKIPLLQGTYYMHNNDVEMVYQIPTASPKGVLFLAHGCSHSAIDWWPKSATCEHCIGLPIEMTIVQEAINNNYAVLAISSVNRAHKCWVARDLPRTQEAIEYFYTSILKLTPNNFIPLHVAGGSSGGGFVGALAQTEHLKPPASTACIIISGAHVTTPDRVPPLLYILMPKDTMTSMRVNAVVTQTPHLKYKILNSAEKSITPDFLHVHSVGSISLEESKTIQEAFLAAGVIDRTTLLLKHDPRQSHWRDVSTSPF
jgi:hypothetical protein